MTDAASATGAVAQKFVSAMNDVFANGDVSALDAVVAANYVDHTPSPTRAGGAATPDLAGLKSSFAAVHDVFPGARVTVDQAIAQGDMAALLVTFNGMRGPGVIEDGVIVCRVAGGKVVASWNYESGGAAHLQPDFAAPPTRG